MSSLGSPFQEQWNWRFHINLEMHTEAKTEEVVKVSDANGGEGTSPETGFPFCHLVFNLNGFHCLYIVLGLVRFSFFVRNLILK